MRKVLTVALVVLSWSGVCVGARGIEPVSQEPVGSVTAEVGKLIVVPGAKGEFLLALHDINNKPLAGRDIGVEDPILRVSTSVKTDAAGNASYKTTLSKEGLFSYRFFFGPSESIVTINNGNGNLPLDFEVTVGVTGIPNAQTLLLSTKVRAMGNPNAAKAAFRDAFARALEENKGTIGVMLAACGVAIWAPPVATVCVVSLKVTAASIAATALREWLIARVEDSELGRAEKDAWIHAIRINALAGKTIAMAAINPLAGAGSVAFSLAVGRASYVVQSSTELRGSVFEGDNVTAFVLKKR